MSRPRAPLSPYLTDPLLRELIPARPPAKPPAGAGPSAAYEAARLVDELEAAAALEARHLRAVGQ